MKTSLQNTLCMALAIAFICPLSMAMADKKPSFTGSRYKVTKPTSNKGRVYKTPVRSSSKTSPTIRGKDGKPLRYSPPTFGRSGSKPGSVFVPKPGSGSSAKKPARNFLPRELNRKKPYLPKTPGIRNPIKPIILPVVPLQPKPNSGIKLFPKIPAVDYGNGVNINRNPIRTDDVRLSPFVPAEVPLGPIHPLEAIDPDDGIINPGNDDNNPADDDNNPDNGNNGNCPDCAGDCHHHHGPSFGLDFPRWGFSYGPNGMFIRGGGQYYNNGPRDVVIVEQPVVINDAGAVVEENVGIREVANLPEVYVASTIALTSKTPLGEEAGQVILDVNGISLPTAVRGWTNESTTCTLPMIGLDKPKEARLVMLTAKGEVAHSISVLLMPAKAPEVAPME